MVGWVGLAAVQEAGEGALRGSQESRRIGHGSNAAFITAVFHVSKPDIPDPHLNYDECTPLFPQACLPSTIPLANHECNRLPLPPALSLPLQASAPSRTRCLW